MSGVMVLDFLKSLGGPVNFLLETRRGGSRRSFFDFTPLGPLVCSFEIAPWGPSACSLKSRLIQKIQTLGPPGVISTEKTPGPTGVENTTEPPGWILNKKTLGRQA